MDPALVVDECGLGRGDHQNAEDEDEGGHKFLEADSAQIEDIRHCLENCPSVSVDLPAEDDSKKSAEKLSAQVGQDDWDLSCSFFLLEVGGEGDGGVEVCSCDGPEEAD
jgi:hypothetical protein